MPMSLLEIVQTACDELGFNRPTRVVASTDLQIRQLYALINRDLREVQQNYSWTALQTEYDLHVAQPITTTGNVTQNSYVISNIPDTSGISANTFVVNGGNLVVASRVVSVDSATQVTISQPATATAASTSMVFACDTYPQPADFDRYINQTWWDRTNRWALMGPDSPQIDQWHRSGIVTIGPRRHFRQIGALGAQGDGSFNNDFNADFDISGQVNYRIWPPPGALDTPIDLVFEYISKNCCMTTVGSGSIPAGTLIPNFQSDSDITILDENIVILGAKWRYFQIKGFAYTALQAEWQDYCDRKSAHDGGAKTLSMSPSRINTLLTVGNIQDGNFPGSGL